jgi:acyl-ACP thioesterase
VHSFPSVWRFERRPGESLQELVPQKSGYLGGVGEGRTPTRPARPTSFFGPDLVDRAVTTLNYVVGDETKAIAATFAL